MIAIVNIYPPSFSLDNYLGDMTAGDIIGMGANLFGANAQMNNTLANRSATPVEQNWFKDYGKQALSKIQEQATQHQYPTQGCTKIRRTARNWNSTQC